jgi:hypothetical protein
MFNYIGNRMTTLLISTARAVFWGLDALGWGIILFLLIGFGIPIARFLPRRASIPYWPVTEARVNHAEVFTGVAKLYPGFVAFNWKTRSNFFHCRAQYVYLVDGKVYENSFFTRAGKFESATEFASEVQNQIVLVKYNSKLPEDSVIQSSKILDRHIIQVNPSLNPRIW